MIRPQTTATGHTLLREFTWFWCRFWLSEVCQHHENMAVYTKIRSPAVFFFISLTKIIRNYKIISFFGAVKYYNQLPSGIISFPEHKETLHCSACMCWAVGLNFLLCIMFLMTRYTNYLKSCYMKSKPFKSRKLCQVLILLLKSKDDKLWLCVLAADWDNDQRLSH